MRRPFLPFHKDYKIWIAVVLTAVCMLIYFFEHCDTLVFLHTIILISMQSKKNESSKLLEKISMSQTQSCLHLARTQSRLSASHFEGRSV